MAVLVIPNSLQVTVSGQLFGEAWANVYGLVNDSAFLLDQTVADEIAAAFQTAYAELGTAVVDDWSLTEIIVRDIRTATSPSFQATTFPQVGLNANDAMPPQTAIVASHSTGKRGASYRGRTYLCGFSESSNTVNGQVVAGTITEIETMFATLNTELATVTGGPFDLAVLSRTLLEANPVTLTRVDQEWDRQNRRKRR